MKSISAGNQAHLLQSVSNLVFCVKITRADGVVIGATSHTKKLEIGSIMYFPTPGALPSNVESKSDFGIDNLEVLGIIDSVLITDADLLGGKYDDATVEMFAVNYKQISDGIIPIHKGFVGEITVGDTSYVAQLQGGMQRLQQTVGELYSVTCRADLGDARCQVDLGLFTVTGTVTSVTDNRTFADIDRGNNSGSSVQINAGGSGYTVGDTLTVSGGTSVTPATLNVDTVDGGGAVTAASYVSRGSYTAIPTNPVSVTGGTGTGATFDLTFNNEVDDWFNLGLFTWTSGNNNGISMEVKDFVSSTGEFTIYQKMPFDVQVGDNYMVFRGCDLLLSTCRDVFDNVDNFRGEPYIPGTDATIRYVPL